MRPIIEVLESCKGCKEPWWQSEKLNCLELTCDKVGVKEIEEAEKKA